MVDWSLLTTVGLILVATLVGAYLRYTSKDAVLKAFDGFHVTLERASGKVVWGVMSLAATGIELVYKDQVQDEDHIESSYVFYSSEYADLQAIYRFVDEMEAGQRERRARDVERSFHPTPLRRLARTIRNVVSTATAALNEVFGVLVGRMKKPAGAYISDKGELYLNKLGQSILSQTTAAYDPLIEQHIGEKVVVELAEGNEVHEHVGIFKNYSAEFFELLNVRFPFKESLDLNPDGTLSSRAIEVTYGKDTLTVHNCSEQPVLLQGLHKAGEELLLNVVVDGDEVVEVHPGPQFVGGTLHIQVVRELDMILPRSRCVLRHHAEHYRPDSLPAALVDMVFDVGFALARDKRLDLREQRLRQQLVHKPDDALALANLGAVLLQERELDEAEQVMHAALKLASQLPDNGKRVRMQLRELQRHRAADGAGSGTNGHGGSAAAAGEGMIAVDLPTTAGSAAAGAAVAAAPGTVAATAGSSVVGAARADKKG